ncbi:MAG: putative two-component sensor kinase [Labilithrix sp.]|nr:putative two-component sensor kinase [Labilithrix sp.]
MKFRTRLVLTLSAATAVTVASAFGTASYVVERSEERQLDEALRAEAHLEAGEIAGQHGSLHVNNRGGPAADDIGRLKKFAVIYDSEGRVVDITSTFASGAPPFGTVSHPSGSAFDFWYGTDHLRGVFVAIPENQHHTLLLAAPRSDLEKDNEFLRQVMLVAALLSIGFTVLVTWRVVRRLTRGHEAIADAARRVAAGDLGARIALKGGDDEVVQLARDVDEMVRRLAILVEGQQRFVAHAAHELRSPLTSLYGELQLALRRSRTADEYKAAIEEALDSAKRLKALAEDLLALARIGADRDAPQTPVALDEVAKSAAAWVAQEAARRNIDLAIEADGSSVLGHANDLERLLRNLLDNAVRHSPDGGHVRVEAHSEGETVHVTVVDDGPGVPIEDRERVFDPFFRAASERRREGGSGLGLAIVREIARGHGGDVSVEDGPGGRGARFRATLPAAPSA